MSPDECRLAVDAATVGDAALLTARGLLDSASYRTLRDRIIKAALDTPAAVIIDVSDLRVPAESAWSVFTSARWHVARWPQVPVVLACEHSAGRAAIRRNGVARYVPVYGDVGEALEAVHDAGPARYRRRARAELSANASCLGRSRELVVDCLTAWSLRPLIPTAKVVVTVLVENVLRHTESEPSVRLETDGTVVTVAVEDDSRTPAGVREDTDATGIPSGLTIVSALCRTWGNAPTPTGKTVWAVLGPENRL